jgi:hypothetical protein
VFFLLMYLWLCILCDVPVMKACVLISYEAKEGVRAYDTYLWGDVVWVQQGMPKIVFPSELV